MKTGLFTDENLWNKLLEESDFDFYHLPAFLNIEKELIGGEPLFFYYENGNSKALIPLIRREIPGTDFFDVASPYGYAGILINRLFNYRLFDEVIMEFLKSCKENKIVSAFLRLNSFLNNYLFVESEVVKQVIHGRTVIVDLSKDYNTLASQYSSNHKRNIKKLKKEGFEVAFNNFDRYPAWQGIYISTMRRLNASSYYYFDEKYFTQLWDALKDHLNLVTVHDKEGELAAGGLFTEYNGIIQYHLGGTADKYRSVAPTKLMFDKVIEWGSNNHQKLLHLGGGLVGQMDSLFRFKYGFSKSLIHSSILRCITNEDVYKSLLYEKFGSKKAIPDSNYFPLYRFKE
jgi:hypothetical protein